MGKFPYYRQLDAMDCGPTCLRMISKYYGKLYSLQFLRKHSYITNGGVSMLGISDAAETIGFRTKGYRLTWEQLRDEVPFPCIIHWNQRHFVVVHDIKTKKKLWQNRSGINGVIKGSKNEKTIIHIADPSCGLVKYTKDEFIRCWLSTSKSGIREGTALLLEPTPDFYNDDEEEHGTKLKFAYLLRYLKPYRKQVLQVMLGMFSASVISLIFPFLTQSIVDYGINNNDLSFIAMILIAQVILTLSQTANGFIRSWLMLHITARISISLISDFLIKLMNLPISFFDSKLIGDIMQRIKDHGRIQSFLTGSLINILFAFISLIVYSIIMAGYHMSILIIFFIGSIVYIGWVLLFLKKRRELDYKRFQQSAANQSNVVQLISGMQEIKLNGCEKQKRWEWERIQAKIFKISIKSLALGQTQQIGAKFINQTKNVLISFLSAKAVVTGDMTLGMMMAVQYIIGQLNSPIMQFISFIGAAQDAKISLERLGEIHDKDDEEKLEDNRIRKIPLGSDIVIKNLMFQYEGPHSEKVLKDINLTILSNKITAIVGTSGSGKTTLIKLLLGFYEPTKGEIFLNGIRLQNFSQREWRRNCGVVMQEGFIFSDSITNNIGVIDEYPDGKKVDKAVKTANIKEFIDGLPLGFETRIGNDGHGISTGQKQRMLMARAVYKDPGYLFLDEATNSLDAKNEKVIMENLNTFFEGRTVIIVAHRLSTVKKADQIVVLEQGEIIEIGNHSDLVKAKGAYFNLVNDQLELGY
jgi:ATP-binding cassette subfamily B protein